MRSQPARFANDRTPLGDPPRDAGQSAVDGGVATLLFLCPFALGGRHPVGHALYFFVAAATALAWFASQARRGTDPLAVPRCAWLLALAAGVTGVQLAPLPPAWRAALAPHHALLFPDDAARTTAGLGLPAWRPLSLAPEETRTVLALLLGSCLLTTAVYQRVQTPQDVERYQRWIGYSAAALAAVGLLQYFFPNGRFLWVYDDPFRNPDGSVTGPLTNRNHFAHLLALGAASLAAHQLGAARPVALRAGEGWRLTPEHLRAAALAASLGVAAFGCLLSLSRGGAATLAVAGAAVCAVLLRQGLLSPRRGCALGCVLLAVVGLLSVHGYDRVAARLDDLTFGSLEALDARHARRTIWEANCNAVRHGGWLGAGAGAHRELHAAYLPAAVDRQFTHAENGPLQVLAEYGWVGGALLGLGLAVAAGEVLALAIPRQTAAEARCAAAAAGIAVGSLAHACVDFVWYIPACVAPVLVSAACTARLRQARLRQACQRQEAFCHGQPTAAAGPPPRRGAWQAVAAGTAVVCGVAGAMLASHAAASLHWDRYLRLVVHKAGETGPSYQEVETRLAEVGEELRGQMLCELREVVRWQPCHARAHSRLAARLVDQFNAAQQHGANCMSLGQIRDAALASRFASREELLAWLRRAFGENSARLSLACRHAREAVASGPLQASAYLLLADLGFLHGIDRSDVDALMLQAERLRPHDGELLFEIGRQQLVLGRYDEALALWTRIFQDPGPHQAAIIDVLALQTPASTLLTTLAPVWPTLRQVWEKYEHSGSDDDRRRIAAYADRQAREQFGDAAGPAAAFAWLSTARMQQAVGEPSQAIASLEAAQRARPNIPAVRRTLALLLLAAQDYGAAETHLRWCLARSPGDERLRAALLACAKGRVAARVATRAADGQRSTAR